MARQARPHRRTQALQRAVRAAVPRGHWAAPNGGSHRYRYAASSIWMTSGIGPTVGGTPVTEVIVSLAAAVDSSMPDVADVSILALSSQT
jgi:hypothetical protein